MFLLKGKSDFLKECMFSVMMMAKEKKSWLFVWLALEATKNESKGAIVLCLSATLL